MARRPGGHFIFLWTVRGMVVAHGMVGSHGVVKSYGDRIKGAAIPRTHRAARLDGHSLDGHSLNGRRNETPVYRLQMMRLHYQARGFGMVKMRWPMIKTTPEIAISTAVV
jgi:hypothetical protein